MVMPDASIANTTRLGGEASPRPRAAPGPVFFALAGLLLLTLAGVAWLVLRPPNPAGFENVRSLPEDWHTTGLPALAPYEYGVIARFRVAPESALPVDLADILTARWDEFRGPFSRLPESSRLAAYFGAGEVIAASGSEPTEWIVAMTSRWESSTLADKLDPILERLTNQRPATFTPLREDDISVQHWRLPGPDAETPAPEFWLAMEDGLLVIAGGKDAAMRWAGLLRGVGIPGDAASSATFRRGAGEKSWQPTDPESISAAIYIFENRL